MTPWTAPVAAEPVRGRIAVPGSKSASARSLLLASLADGPSVLKGVLDSRDTILMRTALTGLGAHLEERPGGELRVSPIETVRGGSTIDCGLSGTVLRFLPPVAGLGPTATRFVGDPAASARPIAGLLDALAAIGATVSTPRALPFTVSGGLLGGAVSLDSSATSQFLSALLLTGPRFPEGVRATHIGGPLPSEPHIEMTSTLLRRRGVEVHRDGSTWQVAPGRIASLDEQIEPDLTNAATILAAALITGGKLSTFWPGDSVQAADELANALKAFGARISYRQGSGGRWITLSGEDGITGTDINLHTISELTPVAAALAALADRPSTIRGVGHIRGHETDRLAALAEGLAALGVGVRELPDGLSITPGFRHGGVFRTHGDHRLAHAAALIGLVTAGVELDDVSCTTKTLPDFPGMWARLLGAAE